MKFLLTGFDRFGTLTINPSEIIVKEIDTFFTGNSKIRLVTEIIRTEFKYAPEKTIELINECSPDIVLMFGVAEGAQKIRLERKAINFTNNLLCDNCGDCFRGKSIMDGAPQFYASNIPFDKLLQKPKYKETPITISDNAGDYVCNHTYYTVLNKMETCSPLPKIGFIHIPMFYNLSKETSLNLLIDLIEEIHSEFENDYLYAES